MLVFDFRTIGNKLLSIRKKAGLTQSEVAEKETVHICRLAISPNRLRAYM